MEISALNAADLLTSLASVDIAVPLRSQGRTKEHTQLYAIARLLSTLAATDQLSFPLCLENRERPDFSLNRTIGIEHSEAVPQNEAHRTFLRERGYGPKWHWTPRALPGEQPKKAGLLIKEIERNDPGRPWMGNSVEREWSAAMMHFISRKALSTKSPGFARFSRQWLLIYDNWPPPAVNRADASSKLFNACRAEGAFEAFEQIFVMSDRLLCVLRAGGVSDHEINDVWKHSKLAA